MEPIFSVITTAKNERDQRLIRETFDNWELTKRLFEEKIKAKEAVEFIVVDAGGNVSLPPIENSKIILPETYTTYRNKLLRKGVIRHAWWDSPSIGRNLGFEHAKGKIIVFQDIDSALSTGTEIDYRYIIPLDKYDNYFCVMYNAFRKKNIVAAAPSSRSRDSKKLGRRFGMMGENYTVWFSLKIPTIRIHDIPIAGPSVPGFNIALLRDVALKIYRNEGRLYDPELAVAEDHKFSRTVGRYGRFSYEKKAGVFVRTHKRVSPGYDIIKSLLYALIWILPYSVPDLWKYKKHRFKI